MDGLVFDLNDCLVDRRDIPMAVQSALEYALEERGDAFLGGQPERGWLIERGKNKPWLFNNLLMQAGVPHEERPEIVERCVNYYYYLTCKYSRDAKPFWDVGALKGLDLPMALVTNTTQNVAKRILHNTELGDYFEKGLVFANGDKVRALRRIAYDLDMHPSSLVYVGDASQDVCTGRIAGTRTVAIDRGYVPLDRLLTARPNLVIKNLAMLGPWLNSGKT